MPAILPELLPVLAFIVLGAALGRSGLLSEAFADGCRRLVAAVTLPVLLFLAFSRLDLEPSYFLLAAVVFASCALLGLVSLPLSAVARLPRPATPLMFQGFEAGMLGYALFSTLYGTASLGAFATADLGQVLYVFTVLMAQLLAGNSDTKVKPLELARGLVRSPIILAIAAGLISAAIVPEAAGLPWAKGGFLAPSLAAVGSLTTPLVCLVVGFGLRNGLGGGRAGFVKALAAVGLRLLAAGGLGLLVALALVPALGLGPLHARAVIVLFVLPPPFVIAVFRRRPGDAEYVSSVLSLHTVASLIAVFAVAVLAGAVS